MLCRGAPSKHEADADRLGRQDLLVHDEAAERGAPRATSDRGGDGLPVGRRRPRRACATTRRRHVRWSRALDLDAVVVALIEPVEAGHVSNRAAELGVVGLGVDVQRRAGTVEYLAARAARGWVAEQPHLEPAGARVPRERFSLFVEGER